ncbi:MAG: YbbR-like domain-containing protein [Nitrospirae bacterium]|nr:YbbR-like domain-containing protein [Nitrospirota bacterium]
MRSKLRDLITTNLWLKAVSLCLAIALWFFVVSKGRSNIIIDAPVEFKNIPAKMELVDVTKTVGINIEGQERLLKNLRQDNISVVIDLENARGGEIYFPLSNNNVKLPKSLIVTKFSPQRIKFILEEKLKKIVRVNPIIIGSPAGDFILRRTEVTPTMIEIEGPASSVKKVYTVKTEPIDITGISEDSQYSASLDITRKNVRSDVSEVKVNISVRRIK